jgi:hypothetical protein
MSRASSIKTIIFELSIRGFGITRASRSWSNVMAEIVSLDTIRGQRTPDPLRDMVEEMEDLLRLAKSGELKGFCFGAITEDGHRALCGFLRTTACNDMELLGLGTYLHQHITNAAGK